MDDHENETRWAAISLVAGKLLSILYEERLDLPDTIYALGVAAKGVVSHGRKNSKLKPGPELQKRTDDLIKSMLLSGYDANVTTVHIAVDTGDDRAKN